MSITQHSSGMLPSVCVMFAVLCNFALSSWLYVHLSLQVVLAVKNSTPTLLP